LFVKNDHHKTMLLTYQADRNCGLFSSMYCRFHFLLLPSLIYELAWTIALYVSFRNASDPNLED